MTVLGDIEVVVFGQTQVGKSTLINKLLEHRVTPPGNGTKPTTMEQFKVCQHPDLPLKIWDTKGIEVQGGDNQLEEVIKWMREKEGEMNPNKMPIALLVLSEQEPIQAFHSFLYEFLHGRMAVIVVLTKAFKKKNDSMLEAANRSFKNAARILRINSEPFEIDEDVVLPAKGIEDLASDMAELLSYGLEVRRQFLTTEASIMKDNAMEKIAEIATSLGRKVGWNPIPFLDQKPVKGAMKDIMVVCQRAFATTFSATFIERFVRSNVPDTGVSWFKFIPVLGSVLAGYYSGVSIHDFALTFGRNFAESLFNVKVKNGRVTEPAVEKEFGIQKNRRKEGNKI